MNESFDMDDCDTADFLSPKFIGFWPFQNSLNQLNKGHPFSNYAKTISRF